MPTPLTPDAKSPPWSSRPKRRVALLVETSNSYVRALLQGVISYVRENKPWSFSLVEQGHSDEAPRWVKNWDGDGIIARVKNRRIAEKIVASGLPVVDLSITRYIPTMPNVEPNDEVVGRLAVEHFTQRGFKHFAYCGDDIFLISDRRGACFRRALAAAGLTCHEFKRRFAASVAISRKVADIGDWLAELPKPLAVFACYDVRGQHVLDACRLRGIAVPEQVAVLGVDNDELLCELASPPLSSVIPNAQRTGYEAARLLDRMMNGETVPATSVLVEPLGISLRQSTEVLAVDDPHIALALRFIREHASEPISVTDVARVVPLSRRILEKRFRQLLNHTLHEEIMSVRLNRVKRLLVESRLSLEQIAASTGYEHPEYLSVVFKREVGLSPRQFREHQRRGGVV